jgi:hypothetical protein
MKSLRKLHTGKLYVQFERRTGASVRATLRASSDPSEGFDPSAPDSDWFVRKRVTVLMDDGSLLACWIYDYKGDATGLPIIASGRFADRGGADG